jgi:hypothetical protein
MNVEYNLKKATDNNEAIDLSHFSYITACKKPEIQDLMEKHCQESLFDVETYTEIVEKDAGKRYVVMYNKLRIESDKSTRDAAIKKTIEKLEKLQTQIGNSKIKTRDSLVKKVGQIETGNFVKKCFSITIPEGKKPKLVYEKLD